MRRRIAALERHGRSDDLTRGDAFALGLIMMIAWPMALSWRLNDVIFGWQVDLGLVDKMAWLGPKYPWLSVLVLAPFGAGLAIGVGRVAGSGPARGLLRRLALLVLALCAGGQLAILITPRDSDLALHWVAAPIAYYHVAVLFLGLAASAVLIVNALAWRRVVARSSSSGWPWLFGGYGVAVALVATPHMTPAVYWIILVVPLIGIARTLQVPPSVP